MQVFTSGIWQLSSVAIESRGECLLVDPAYFPRELADLRTWVDRHGRAVAVAFTHVHWDHVVGWQTFPEADVWGSAALARAVADDAPEARRGLDKARALDREWYVERDPPLRWPPALRPLGEGDEVRLGDLTLRALSLAGHSADGLGLLVEEARVLIAGDHLSPCEIPFVDDLPAYRATLQRIIPAIAELDGVIPGHGRRLHRDEALAIARADLAYLDAIAWAAERGEVARALAVALPRGGDDPAMRAHHRANCVAAGLELPPEEGPDPGRAQD